MNIARIVDAPTKWCRLVIDLLMSQGTFVKIASLAARQLFMLFGSLAALLRNAIGVMSGPAYKVFLEAFANINIRDAGRVVTAMDEKAKMDRRGKAEDKGDGGSRAEQRVNRAGQAVV